MRKKSGKQNIRIASDQLKVAQRNKKKTSQREFQPLVT
jgi:hypothetical protein